jgi:hypothetical protein
MGTEITPELLSQIQSKKLTNSTNKITNENKFAKKVEKPKIKEIITDIYSPYIKKKENINIENNLNENIINIKQEEDDINLNHIFFQEHKSFDSSYNFYKKNEIMNSNKIFENSDFELLSEKNNESIISDYADISQDMINFNNKNKKEIEKNKNKEINAKSIRDKYYNKLITKLEWNPFKKEKIINNLFFFDWDDTLLCTSYLQPTGALIDMEINKRDKDIISDLDSLVSKLLLKAMNIGIVFIVTNGAPGWVELSSTKFYPKTAKILQKIKVVSARGLCERKYPGDMRQWKRVAFKFALDTLHDINKNIVTNIICLGDSNIEMEASYYLKECFPNAYLKTIKFKESPTHIELQKELKIINIQLDSIINNYNKNLSVKVTRKKND